MWRKLRKQIAVEREMMHQLLSDHEPLLRKCAVATPDRIELSALAALLHAFYNGVENVFKRTAVELGEGLPRPEGWHKELLEAMTHPGPQRPKLISVELAAELLEFLKFRHFFRACYPSQLRWRNMAPLATTCREVFARFEQELDVFLAATREKD